MAAAPTEHVLVDDTEVENSFEAEAFTMMSVESDGDGGDDLVILDPSHPLMERVQAALKEQLARQNDKLRIDLKKQQETVKNVQKERERLGVQLYNVQQHLARQHMLLEKELDEVNNSRSLREVGETTLGQLRELYNQLQEQYKMDRQQTEQLRHEVEDVSSRLKFLSDAHETVQKDIALTQRVTEKTAVDVAKAEENKLDQDLYVDRLTSQIAGLEEKLALFDAQHSVQCQETKTVHENLMEAGLELDALMLEKKKLFQQWNNTLVGMRRRDEAYSAMVVAVSQLKQQLRTLETEIGKYRKSTTQEQERNEQLTLMINKLYVDVTHVGKQLSISHDKYDLLKTEFTAVTRTLQETEQALARSTTDCSVKRNELAAVRTQTEREAREKKKMEDGVMEKMMQQLTMDKSTQYTRISVERMQTQKEKLERARVDLENETAITLLKMASLTADLKRLKTTLDAQTAVIEKHNDFITQSETVISHSNALIERKQTQIDQVNKRIALKMGKFSGEEEVGPLELKIDTLQKQISDSTERCTDKQSFWLREQNELVRRTKDADTQARAVGCLGKEYIILEQKRMRIDAHLEREKKERASVEKSVSRLQHEMKRLTTLISEKSDEQYRLEQSNLLIQNDFVDILKDSELDCIQLQSSVKQLGEETERLRNSSVEAEHQIMLWERKIQLAKEMREMVDSETGQAEVKAMKAEIHRMQVKHNQLLRQQEMLIQNMEKAVCRRETIEFKGEVQVKVGKSEQTQGYLKRKASDIERQIRKTASDTAKYDKVVNSMSEDVIVHEKELETQQELCWNLKSQILVLEQETSQCLMTKKQNTIQLHKEQARHRQIVAAKEGKYLKMTKSRENRDAEREKLLSSLGSIKNVVFKMKKDYPFTLEFLQNILVSLGTQG